MSRALWNCGDCGEIGNTSMLCRACNLGTDVNQKNTPTDPQQSASSAQGEDDEREQIAREIVTKHALWDAGFCGAQSSERGPVMLKVFELIELAIDDGIRIGAERERERMDAKLAGEIARQAMEIEKLRSDLALAREALDKVETMMATAMGALRAHRDYGVAGQFGNALITELLGKWNEYKAVNEARLTTKEGNK